MNNHDARWPATLDEAQAALAAPFAQKLIELKPSNVTKDKTRCMVAAYVDMRAYFARLDRAVGPGGWATSYTMHDRGIVCNLTILGVTRSSVGDWPAAGDPNAATSAEAQAFKRACAAFGLGRYLYALPNLWVDYDEQRKRIAGDPAAIVYQMYQRLGLDEGGE